MTAAWQPPPAELALDGADVHVWRVALDPPAERVAALARTLDDDERARAARFHFDRDRTAFTVARGALRTLAGRYLGESPARLRFGYRDRGKPYLLAPPVEPPGQLRFNVSHSGKLALLCFARDREVGVDIEHRRPLSDLLGLAHTAFSPPEYAALCRLPPAAHERAFFACWSRKEAFIKATGEGVAQLAAFEVSLAPGEPARLVRVDGEPSGRWSLHELPAIPDYAAALVVEASAHAAFRLACWDGPLDDPPR
ncbi:MAG TPA: 4'-phosphopantetheinyl transferase superfamily protein [Kofleriaceae bacterium]|nr:4'-phosphopantetheinyl transferase superfamily protein [Kofleriaceae bacterium]